MIPDNENNQVKICYEISTIYVYDIIDEYKSIDQIDYNQAMVPFYSSSSSPSSFDEQTVDKDDGYSTHSLDDIEQQQTQQLLVIPSLKLMVPVFLGQHYYDNYYCEQYASPIHQLIERLIWISPFKKTMQKMMNQIPD